MSNLTGGEKYLRFNFSLKKRIGLYERLAAFLESNISIMDTLNRIQYRYDRNHDSRAKILKNWITSMEHGSRFSDAIQPWIPASEHMLIAAGERGEGLINGLKEATVMSTSSKSIKNAIYAGLAMPIGLLAMMSFMLTKFQTTMVPVFKSLLPVSKWPSSAQLLNSISYSIAHLWWLVGIVLIIIFTIIYLTIGRWTGKARAFFDHLPPWSIYRTAQASSFLIGLSSLMKAGVAGFDALKMMHHTASPWMQFHLEKMMSVMRLGGASSGRALNTGLLDKETAGDVEDYSQLGSFQDAIYLLGARTLVESVTKINSRMGVVRNLLLVTVASNIVWIYSTIYSLQGVIASSMGAQ